MNDQQQISALTIRINRITKHLVEHPNDVSTKRGLCKLVAQKLAIKEYHQKRATTIGTRP